MSLFNCVGGLGKGHVSKREEFPRITPPQKQILGNYFVLLIQIIEDFFWRRRRDFSIAPVGCGIAGFGEGPGSGNTA